MTEKEINIAIQPLIQARESYIKQGYWVPEVNFAHNAINTTLINFGFKYEDINNSAKHIS